MFATLPQGGNNVTSNWQPVLKIHGRLNFLAIEKIEKCLTVNASKTTSELGGGAYGHLGQVKTALHMHS